METCKAEICPSCSGCGYVLTGPNRFRLERAECPDCWGEGYLGVEIDDACEDIA